MIALTKLKIFIAATLQRIIAAACINLIIGDTKHSLIPFVCILSVVSDIFYSSLASVSDASRPVMINNTNSVPNPSI